MQDEEVYTHESLKTVGLCFVKCTLKHNAPQRNLTSDNDFFNAKEKNFEGVRRLYITEYRDGYGSARGGILDKKCEGRVLQKAVSGKKDTNFFFMATADPSKTIATTALESRNDIAHKSRNDIAHPENKVAFLRMLQIIGEEKLVNCENCCSFRTNLLKLLNG